MGFRRFAIDVAKLERTYAGAIRSDSGAGNAANDDLKPRRPVGSSQHLSWAQKSCIVAPGNKPKPIRASARTAH